MEITKADLVKGGVGLVTGGPLGAVLSPIVGRAVMDRTWAWALIGVVAGPMSWVISTLPITLMTYEPEQAKPPAAVEDAPAAAALEPAAASDPVKTVPEQPAPVLERIPSERVPEAAAPITAPVPAPTAAPPPAAVARLTGSQRNAVRSARQYLSFKGFSRDGLIHQLTSDAGDGYPLADATIAVDSLGVDWNEQAVRSAKNYLQLMGFSCNRLIQQLSSSAGDKYTQSQAAYGAQKAGAC